MVARETARRMAARLDYVRIDPDRVLDAGCGLAEDRALLRSRYPRAHYVGLDFALEVLRAGRPNLGERAAAFFGRAPSSRVCGDMARLPFGTSAFGLVWSNLALGWTPDPMPVLAEFHRVLAPGGLLMFCSYGPDTLKELRSAFARSDAMLHVHAFADMHDIGDLLVAAGFATPVVDMEMLTLTYEQPQRLFRDLRDTGQVNVMQHRRRTLTGRGRWQRMLDAYEGFRSGGRLPATVELVYGHAWKGEPVRRNDAIPIRFHPRATRRDG